LHGAPSRPIRTLEEAEAFLERLVNVERRPDLPYSRLGLEPIQRLLARVGNPQRALSVVHIAGSKGKGSTALFVESILRSAGVRVGAFTSPHLERWTERFRVDGTEVGGARLAAAVERLRPHVEALHDEDPVAAPTFFDVTTAAAFLLFAEARVERAVVEVGLGGRLDSTNVVDPAVACITTIELEHTDRLGGTLAAIAGEKAGIVKAGRPVVVGRLPAEALAVVEQRAAALGAPLARLDREIRLDASAHDAGLRVRIVDGGLRVDVTVAVLGAHQAANAALAVACVRRLGAFDDATLADAAARGLATAQLPGRIELLARAPWTVVDGAHTEASARALAGVLAALPHRRCRLVLSVSAGKNLAGILAALAPLADEIYATRAEPTRSLEPRAIADAARAAAPSVPLHAVPNPFLALRAAREGLGEGDLVCATGSVYLAGLARRCWAAADPVQT
jgi:dihydrofolate synthase/folylpolyglutamate synthase